MESELTYHLGSKLQYEDEMSENSLRIKCMSQELIISRLNYANVVFYNISILLSYLFVCAMICITICIFSMILGITLGVIFLILYFQVGKALRQRYKKIQHSCYFDKNIITVNTYAHTEPKTYNLEDLNAIYEKKFLNMGYIIFSFSNSIAKEDIFSKKLSELRKTEHLVIAADKANIRAAFKQYVPEQFKESL